VPFRLRGVIPPLVTPFRADGSLDLAAFEANLEAYAGSDLGGYLVLGSNGEAGSLEEDEKRVLVRVARAAAGARPLLVGTGRESTRATLAFTRQAADAGADAALVLTPHYYKAQMTADALIRHFEAVADASPIPVLLYSVPQFTGLPFPPGVAATLSQHPNVGGMKESSGDVGLLARIRAIVPERFQLACGSAGVFLPALCLGVPAGVLAVACCVPGPTSALYRAFEAGDLARARRLHEALLPLALAVSATWGVAGLKAAMDLAGLGGGATRAPLLPVPPPVREELRALIEQARSAA
jgi:4-hydroxy-2-oxoglutarate aldolase